MVQIVSQAQLSHTVDAEPLCDKGERTIWGGRAHPTLDGSLVLLHLLFPLIL